ncbi:hypothetical protein J2W35_001700 [Variovorax boronicumulans]|uniref:RNA polymerase sigma factor n=1 Tax=Variovorax boronicumulans TaxID=436515 RepID=UPI002788E584|nr:RNA polymerase sigma factor [Variovorax boronicumulans]MDQ0081361.1 hypothetical protein [Variovorax boronicumulans]
MTYLLRIASNVAEDRRISSGRLLDFVEVEELPHFADESQGPARLSEARSEVQALERALEELPRRRREIFIASRVDETPHKDIALRHGVSVRIVEREVKAALVHCAGRLGRGQHPGEGRICWPAGGGSSERRCAHQCQRRGFAGHGGDAGCNAARTLGATPSAALGVHGARAGFR